MFNIQVLSDGAFDVRLCVIGMSVRASCLFVIAAAVNPAAVTVVAAVVATTAVFATAVSK